MEERKWRRLHKSYIRRFYPLSSTLLARHEVDERNARKVSWTNYGRSLTTVPPRSPGLLIVGRMIQ